ncbi:MAG TPA: hypothetical protein VII58_14195, partial [Acidobacteriaceae bacterium]
LSYARQSRHRIQPAAADDPNLRLLQNRTLPRPHLNGQSFQAIFIAGLKYIVPVSQAGVRLGSLLGVFLLGDTFGPQPASAALILAAAILITTRAHTRVREQQPST